MARGYVKPMPTRGEMRWRAHVVPQGITVWADNGWASLSEAMQVTASIVSAFETTDRLGQLHRPWSVIVDEAAADL